MDPEQITAPELPGKQCFWALTLRCIQHMGNYWAVHLPPNITDEFCLCVDDAVQTMVIASTQLNSSTLAPFTIKRMRLPIKYNGMRLRSLHDRRHAKYVGGMIQGIPPLVNQLSPFKELMTGRLHIPSIVQWLGDHSFDGDPEKKPWEKLLSNVCTVVGRGLREAWTVLQEETIENCMKHEMIAPIDLLNYPVERAGFNNNSKIAYKSVTKQLTIEIESVRSELLSREVYSKDASFTNKTREQTAYQQVDNLSSQFLIALPDVLGTMLDTVILEVFHRYIGQPSPAMRHYIESTHYIGRMRMEAVVDKYGDIVARSCLKDGYYWIAHEELKYIMNAIFRQVGFATAMEAPNIFHGKVPEACIKTYVRLHRKKDTIIPDILIHNHPGDRNSGGARYMGSIYDVKTLQIDKTQAFYSETRKWNFRRVVDNKVIRVRKEYLTKAEKLDVKCGENYTHHPFLEALKHKFNSGCVHPIVFGAFGETNG